MNLLTWNALLLLAAAYGSLSWCWCIIEGLACCWSFVVVVVVLSHVINRLLIWALLLLQECCCCSSSAVLPLLVWKKLELMLLGCWCWVWCCFLCWSVGLSLFCSCVLVHCLMVCCVPPGFWLCICFPSADLEHPKGLLLSRLALHAADNLLLWYSWMLVGSDLLMLLSSRAAILFLI